MKKKKCKHNFAYDAEKFWCIKCGHTEHRETPATLINTFFKIKEV